MDCAIECCVDCYTFVELIRVWFRITFEITIRIVTQIARSPLLIIIVVTVIVARHFRIWRVHGEATVISGHTIEIKGQRIRFEALTALQLNQMIKWRDGTEENGGKFCMAALQEKISGRHVKCRISYKDRRDRLVGVCRYKGDDVGKWMVQNGYAVAHPAYGNMYIADYRKAERRQLGIHKGEFEDPRDFVRRKRRAHYEKRFKELELTGEVGNLTNAELEAKIGYSWEGSVLVDTSGEASAQLLAELAEYTG